ncbi:acyltransferase family protein [Pelagicoccus mobilis]|uniref:Acyltransferase family protein n=1 Tax=Pelagicoccus mobilis TaxID=415221 RepID=A0A934RYE6_9BACT|nr:acyltransferase family protein [Pelagicoccus mobilis]
MNISSTTCKQQAIKARQGSIEVLRIISALFILLFHIDQSPYKNISHSGLICFIIISIVFQSKSANKTSARDYYSKRITRISNPWLFWFTAYLIINISTQKPLFPQSHGIVNNILTGPWIGLWFFPFILITSITIFPIIRSLSKTNSAIRIAFYSASTLLLLTLYSTLKATTQTPWPQWLRALPSIPLALITYELTQFKKQKTIPTASLTAFTALSCTLLAPSLTTTYTIATSATAIAFSLEKFKSAKIYQISSLCLGVYVTHSIYIKALNKVVPSASSNFAAVFAFSAILSFLGAYILSKTKLRLLIT